MAYGLADNQEKKYKLFPYPLYFSDIQGDDEQKKCSVQIFSYSQNFYLDNFESELWSLILNRIHLKESYFSLY